MGHARIVKKDNFGKAVPQGYDTTKLSNVQNFADRLGAELEQAGRIAPNDAIWIKHNPSTGNLSLEFSSNQNKYYVNLNSGSLSGNPQDVRGFLSDRTPDAQITSILNQLSGKQQGYQNGYQRNNYQQSSQGGYNGGNQYAGRPVQNSYHNNGYQNGYNGNQGGYQRNGYNAENNGYNAGGYQNGNTQQQNGYTPSMVGVNKELDRNAPAVAVAVKAAVALGNQIAERIGLQPQPQSPIWVNPDNFGGLSLTLKLVDKKLGEKTVYFYLNQQSLMQGNGAISKIADLNNALDGETIQLLMNEFAVQNNNIFLGQETRKAVSYDNAIAEAVKTVDMTASHIANIIANMPEKPTYIGRNNEQHSSGIIINAKHREDSSAIDVTISITDKKSTLNIGFSATSITKHNPAIKYMQIYPKETEASPILQSILTEIEQNPKIAKMEDYRYHTAKGNPEKITAQETVQPTDTIRISDMVNVQDSFVMQGIEKMKLLARDIQANLEKSGINNVPVVFVGKHGNPPAYVANIEIADGNCQMKLFVSDSSLKKESTPHIYDFSAYDHARGIQGREKQLTDTLKKAMSIIENSGYFRDTELQSFAKEYNSNPEHKTTTAVYHRAGDIYSNFGKTATVNTEMVEILSKDGVNKAVPMAYLNAQTGEIDVLVKTPNMNIMSSQLSPKAVETLASNYLSVESMQTVCRIAHIPEPQNKAHDMIEQAENAGIHTMAETKKPAPPQSKRDFLTDVKVTMSIDSQQFSQKPSGGEIGGIKARLATNPPREYSIKEVMMASNAGKTVCPAVVVPAENKNGNLSHNENGWQSQQMFFVDIDNSIPDTHIPLTKEQGFLTMRDALNLCAENNINVVSMYESFSSTPDFQRFRMTVLLPEPVTSLEEQHKVVQGLTSVFGQAADQKCFNGDRIFFGNAPNQHSYQIVKDEQHLYTAKETLLNLYEKNVAPYQHETAHDEESDYVGTLFDAPDDFVQESMNPEEDLYTVMERLDSQGFRGSLQDLKQASGYQGSTDSLKEYVENCGFNNLVIQQKTQQDKIAG